METISVLNIQHFSLHDGPGIRTTCFLPGCNLRCRWCHNPESFACNANLRYWEQKCIGCGRCITVCPHMALSTNDGTIRLDREQCRVCGQCTFVCPSGALESTVTVLGEDELLRKLLRDRMLYDLSGGGVTFSGGEPLLHSKAVARLAEQLSKEGIHMAVDTAACIPWASIAECLPFAHLFLCDIKAMNADLHKACTGVDNRLILENIRRIAYEKPVWIRIPVVKGANYDPEDMAQIAAFVADMGDNIQKVELLPYHDLGVGKYKALGLPHSPFEALGPNEMEELAAVFRRCGVDATIS